MSEKLTEDIELPNLSNRVDPRLNTVWHRDARRRTAEAKRAAAPARSGGVRGMVSRTVANWRTFSKGPR